jgi:hypothetical protein
LAGVVINMLLGDNGIVTQARWSKFVTEMSEIAEKVKLEANRKAAEIYTTNTDEVLATLFEEKYSQSDVSDTLKREVEFLGGDTSNLYKVKLDDVEENTYLYEPTIKVVFKIEGIKIYGTTIHSVEYRNQNSNISADETVTTTAVVDMVPNYTNGYYEPNLDGFDSRYTYIIYYNTKDFSDTKEITAEEYLNLGRPQALDDDKNPQTIENGKYVFYNYIDVTSSGNSANTSIWGNVKTYANGQEAWWVWIPRYSYDTSKTNSNTGFTIKFTTVENKILDLEGNELGTVGDGDYANYISHSGFTEKYTDEDGNTKIAKELTGLWMSKYEPSVTTSFESEKETVCYAPNLEGYDVNNTYIVTYDKDGSAVKNKYLLADILNAGYTTTDAGSLISGTVNTSKIPSDEVWYDYANQIWGNIVTTANGQEAWWVWIPRYEYSIEGESTGFSVVFVDTSDEPFESFDDPLDTYTVHPGFNITEDDGTVTKLKGIWMSKYEPSTTTTSTEATSEIKCYAPNLEGFNINNTYIVTYDKDGSAVKNKYLLKDMLKSGYTLNEDGESLKSGEVDLSKIPDDEVWYDYGNQIWGNVMTNANNLEAWWVWIPRYSYCLESSSTGFAIMFVDTDDKPLNRQEDDPLNMFTIHPGFNVTETDGTVTKLKGIWMSKYEPSGNPSSTDLNTPEIK